MGNWLGFWHQLSKQRRKRALLYALAVLVAVGTLYAARSVLGIYFLGLVFAYLLAPVVDLINHGLCWIAGKWRFGFLRRFARSLSVMVTYFLVVAVIAGFVALVVPIIIREGQQLWAARERIIADVTGWGEWVLDRYELLPDPVRDQIDDTLRDLGNLITRALQEAVGGLAVAVTYTFGIVLAVAIIPAWVYFLLRDFDQIRDAAYAALPEAAREDVRIVLRLLDRTVGSYVRGQLLLMVIVGVMQAVAMSIIGVQYALLLGVIAGLLEFVPHLGPTLAAIPAILVALAQSPMLALLTVVATRIVQMIESSLITPNILGSTMDVHPAILMVVLIVGAEIAGLPGIILAPILTAVLRDVYRYFSFRFADTPCTPDEAYDRAISGASFSVDV